MTQLQTVQNWLQTYPPFAQLPIATDVPYGTAEAVTLVGRGMEEVSSRSDILGQKHRRLRYRFLLQWQQTQADGAQIARLQQWVQSQSDLGLAPVFGLQNLWQSKLVQVKQHPHNGTENHALSLTVEFTRMD